MWDLLNKINRFSCTVLAILCVLMIQILDWLEDPIPKKDVWRFITTENGEQSVTTTLNKQTEMLCADNWVIHQRKYTALIAMIVSSDTDILKAIHKNQSKMKMAHSPISNTHFLIMSRFFTNDYLMLRFFCKNE